MAKMIPENLTYYNPTDSEYILLSRLKSQLGDDYTLFYSLRWDSEVDGDSECDILVFHPNKGFITIEVKGGAKIEIHQGTYYLTYTDGDQRILKRSPHSQAELSMRYFLNSYEATYNKPFSGIHGYCAAFPYYIVDSNTIDHNATRTTTIDVRDMEHLREKIEDIFNHFKNKTSAEIMLLKQDAENMYQLINKSLVLGVIRNKHIEQVNKQIAEATRMQEMLLTFIKNYHEAIIIGGAGTGKSYLAYKKTAELLIAGKRVLFMTLNNRLKEEAKKTTLAFMNTQPVEANYCFCTVDERPDFAADFIILDETQDYELSTLTHIKAHYPKTNFYLFLDPHQAKDSLVNVEVLKEIFHISNPPFVLAKNIRNTANILNYLKTSYPTLPLYANSFVSGSDPIDKVFYNPQSVNFYLNDLIHQLVNIEHVAPDSITILQNLPDPMLMGTLITDIQVSLLEDFKGLENDIIIFVTLNEPSLYEKYLAYTRARYMLYNVSLKN